MINYLLFLYRLSRPRFWLYIAGTYVVGYAAGITSLQDFLNPQFFVYVLFFLIPANIFLYGVNDLYDGDTDQFNQKKGAQEQLLVVSQIVKLRITLLVITMVNVGVLITASSVLVAFLLCLFYFLSYFYSAPPLRFKAHPGIDFISNLLYGLPGFIGYVQVVGHLPPWPIIIGVCCWTWAMHLFSAVPDISSDAKAGLSTTAVVLGVRQSLVLCLLLWFISVLVLWLYLPISILGFMVLVYLFIPLYLLFYPGHVQKAYWYFPLLNTIVGFVLFTSVVFLF